MARGRGRSGGGGGGFIVVAALALLALAYLPGFDSLMGGSAPTTTGAPTTSPTSTLPPTQADIVVAGVPLRVAESSGGSYQRSDWPHWRDIDGDGCDARQSALIRDALPLPSGGSSAQVDAFGCRVLAGDWLDPFWGLTITDPSAIDVDHIVPLADANRSGGQSWDTDRRTSFANDPLNLWSVSAGANRSKGDKSPDEWRPGRCDRSAPGWCDGAPIVTWQGASYTARTWCDYSTLWAQAKSTYDLTVTLAEAGALIEMQEFC
jgi:hypothetical protein